VLLVGGEEGRGGGAQRERGRGEETAPAVLRACGAPDAAAAASLGVETDLHQPPPEESTEPRGLHATIIDFAFESHRPLKFCLSLYSKFVEEAQTLDEPAGGGAQLS